MRLQAVASNTMSRNFETTQISNQRNKQTDVELSDIL